MTCNRPGSSTKRILHTQSLERQVAKTRVMSDQSATGHGTQFVQLHMALQGFYDPNTDLSMTLSISTPVRQQWDLA